MRKAKPKKRILLPDPVYNDQLVTRFVNSLMYDGKKNVAYEIFYGALNIIQAKNVSQEDSPLAIFKKALENVTPQVEVMSRRVGGATFQIPSEIRPGRKLSIGIRNLILYTRKRSGKSMRDKLAAELMAAYNHEGGAFKKKEDTHKMAEANKAFSHYRF
jgi:small subunit ribosomal protein S7